MFWYCTATLWRRSGSFIISVIWSSCITDRISRRLLSVGRDMNAPLMVLEKRFWSAGILTAAENSEPLGLSRVYVRIDG